VSGGSPKSQKDVRDLQAQLRKSLPALLPEYLRCQRWFAGKAGQIESVKILDIVNFGEALSEAQIVLAEVQYASGLPERYALPLIMIDHVQVLNFAIRDSSWLCGDEVVLRDALQNSVFLTALLNSLKEAQVLHGSEGRIETKKSAMLDDRLTGSGVWPEGQLLKSEQSNSSIRFGDELILKFFRRLSEGINPELEMGAFLTERAHFRHTPAVLGSFTYYQNDGSEFTLGVLQEFVRNEGNAWSYTLKQFETFCQMAIKSGEADPGGLRDGSAALDDWFDSYLEDAEKLGAITAEMHVALASDASDPAFAPEEWTAQARRESERNWIESARNSFDLLRRNVASLTPDLRPGAQQLLDHEDEVLRIFRSGANEKLGGMIMRIHGDYHLGQVLRTNSDFVIIDFEGEPARPIAERRSKQSPVKDIAGMLRSFEYAAHSQSVAPPSEGEHLRAESKALVELGSAWAARVKERFMRGYLSRAENTKFLPPDRESFNAMLRIYLLEKALYEMSYELNSRPSWVGIPLDGIQRLLPS
jgi:trehalose synthase-fused probable maltokinase